MSQLRMKIDSLRDLPEIDLPTGLEIRDADLSDAAEITHCLREAFPEFDWTEQKVVDHLLANRHVTVTLVVVNEGRVLATSSCMDLQEQPQTGYVHWVGARSEARGKGMGRAVTLATLLRFRAQGKADAILETDDERLPAIKSYLALGFVPCPREDEDQDERWSKVLGKLRSGL